MHDPRDRPGPFCLVACAGSSRLSSQPAMLDGRWNHSSSETGSITIASVGREITQTPQSCNHSPKHRLLLRQTRPGTPRPY